MSSRLLLSALSSCLLISQQVSGWYLPGVAPTEFVEGAAVPITVTKMVSEFTQVPLDFHQVLNLCRPNDTQAHGEMNLGQLLSGDTVSPTSYEVLMGEDEECKLLCVQMLSEAEVRTLEQKIQVEYRVEYAVDNLAVALIEGDEVLSVSQPLGHIDGEKVYFNNHIEFELHYHKYVSYEELAVMRSNATYRVVHASARMFSRDTGDVNVPCAETAMKMALPPSGGAQIPLTYSVRWKESDVKWASRWDVYLKSGSPRAEQVHWLSLIRFSIIFVMLTAVVGSILASTVLKDIAVYNRVGLEDMDDEVNEQSGWKLLHGDVFRKPDYFSFLCVAAGTGVQLLLVVFLMAALAVVGVISPAYRGLLLKALLFGYVLMGIPAGFIAARVCTIADPKADRAVKITLWTAMVFPLICFAVFFCNNLLLWYHKSSGTVSFATLLMLFLLWLLVAFPLVLFGAYCGFMCGPVSVPVRTNIIARQIPQQPGLMSTWLLAPLGGAIVFGAFSTEFQTLMTAIWAHEYYSFVGFFFIAYICTAVMAAEVALVFCYLQLVSENWRWWWRSFLIPAFAGVWVFIAACHRFFVLMPTTSITGSIIYFSYMLLVSYGVALMTGAIGLLSCCWFIRAIYASVRID